MAEDPTKRPLRPADIAGIENQHKTLAKNFERHQEALIGLDLSNSLAELEDFSRTLRRHIRMEEDLLLPAFERLEIESRISNPDLIREEHRKIETQLDEILSVTRNLRPGAASRRKVLELLEMELRFKNLVEHHVQREETSFLPLLRRHLDGEAAS